MWLDKEEQSRWAYKQCLNGKDTKEYRNLIVSSSSAYSYCKHIKNTEEMRNKITDPFWAFCYCKDIEYDERMAKIVLNNKEYPVLVKQIKIVRRKKSGSIRK